MKKTLKKSLREKSESKNLLLVIRDKNIKITLPTGKQVRTPVTLNVRESDLPTYEGIIRFYSILNYEIIDPQKDKSPLEEYNPVITSLEEN